MTGRLVFLYNRGVIPPKSGSVEDKRSSLLRLQLSLTMLFLFRTKDLDLLFEVVILN